MIRAVCSLALLLLVLSAPARAREPGRVVVMPPRAQDRVLFEAFGRLRAELVLQGFEVIALPPVQGSADPGGGTPYAAARRDAGSARGDAWGPGQLNEQARARGAFAAIALERRSEGTAAAIWLVDRVTGKTTLREVAIASTADAANLLAIRAVDLLRASLRELPPRARPAEDVLHTDAAAPAPEVATFTELSSPALRFELQVGVLALGGGTLSVGAGPSAALSWRVGPRWALALEVASVSAGGTFTADVGKAMVDQHLVSAGASLNLAAAAAGTRLAWGPFVTAGTAYIDATSEVAAPMVAERAQAWCVAGQVGLRGAYYFSDTVSLAISASALGLWPRPVIAIDEARSAPLALQGVATLRGGVAF